MAIGRQPRQVERQFRKLRNHKVLAAKSIFSCEMKTFSLRNFRSPCCKLQNPLECSQIFATDYFRFFFRYLLFKSPFSPYNPPIIGFLSQEVRRKGEQTFYIIYCNFLLKDIFGVFLRDQLCIVWKKVKHRALLCLTYSF